MKILFLDVDGVLNAHERHPESGVCGINLDKMFLLNAILKETGARIVLISAWRYMILCEEMTLKGFEYLFRTHGLRYVEGEPSPFKDYFPHDPSDLDPNWKAQQILTWLKRCPTTESHVVLDDNDFGYTNFNIPFVQTEGNVGLTLTKATEVIALLNKR